MNHNQECFRSARWNRDLSFICSSNDDALPETLAWRFQFKRYSLFIVSSSPLALTLISFTHNLQHLLTTTRMFECYSSREPLFFKSDEPSSLSKIAVFTKFIQVVFPHVIHVISQPTQVESVVQTQQAWRIKAVVLTWKDIYLIESIGKDGTTNWSRFLLAMV